MEMSFWRNFRHWLLRENFQNDNFQPVTNLSSEWQHAHFHFSVHGFETVLHAPQPNLTTQCCWTFAVLSCYWLSSQPSQPNTNQHGSPWINDRCRHGSMKLNSESWFTGVYFPYPALERRRNGSGILGKRTRLRTMLSIWKTITHQTLNTRNLRRCLQPRCMTRMHGQTCSRRQVPSKYQWTLETGARITKQNKRRCLTPNGPLQWRHHERDGVSNHQPHDCLLNGLSYKAQIKENIKAPRHWPLRGEITGDRWIPRTKGQ